MDDPRFQPPAVAQQTAYEIIEYISGHAETSEQAQEISQLFITEIQAQLAQQDWTQLIAGAQVTSDALHDSMIESLKEYNQSLRIGTLAHLNAAERAKNSQSKSPADSQAGLFKPKCQTILWFIQSMLSSVCKQFGLFSLRQAPKSDEEKTIGSACQSGSLTPGKSAVASLRVL